MCLLDMVSGQYDQPPTLTNGSLDDADLWVQCPSLCCSFFLCENNYPRTVEGKKDTDLDWETRIYVSRTLDHLNVMSHY